MHLWGQLFVGHYAPFILGCSHIVDVLSLNIEREQCLLGKNDGQGGLHNSHHGPVLVFASEWWVLSFLNSPEHGS